MRFYKLKTLILSPLKTPFEYTGGNLCLDFANTVNKRTDPARREELLTNYDRLLQWSRESGALGKEACVQLQRLAAEAPGNAQSALRSAIQLRDAIFDIFLAVTERWPIPQTALALLNKEIRRTFEHSEITNNTRSFAWEWLLPERNLEAMLWPVARAAAQLLTSEDLNLVRQCAAEDCAWLFLDATKNHRRRWCEMKTCGNRSKARNYYQRQKSM